MKKIVIIGAGAMGSAFSVPCADNSNEVFLIGSFLEDKVIDEIKNSNNFHPILKSQLPKNIKVINIERNLEDVIVSHYFHLMNLRKINKGFKEDL